MANITMRLKDVLEVVQDKNIGLDVYPIFNESYRQPLNQKIIDTYWNREIAFESVDEFVRSMRTRMAVRMSTYNQLFKSQLLAEGIDPLLTISMSTESEAESVAVSAGNDSSTSESDSATHGRTVDQSFPQNALSGNSDYASAASDANNYSTGEAKAKNERESEDKGNQTSKSKTSGFQGSQADLIMRFRDTIINVEELIVYDVRDQFLMVFNNGDTYTDNTYPSAYYLGR